MSEHTPYPSTEAMMAAVELEIHAALGRVQTVVIGRAIQKAINASAGLSTAEPTRETLEAALGAIGAACTASGKGQIEPVIDFISRLTRENKTMRESLETIASRVTWEGGRYVPTYEAEIARATIASLKEPL